MNIRAELLAPPEQIRNVIVIEDRAYEIRAFSVTHNGFEIFRAENPIMGECVCFSNLILFISTGEVLMISISIDQSNLSPPPTVKILSRLHVHFCIDWVPHPSDFDRNENKTFITSSFSQNHIIIGGARHNFCLIKATPTGLTFVRYFKLSLRLVKYALQDHVNGWILWGLTRPTTKHDSLDIHAFILDFDDPELDTTNVVPAKSIPVGNTKKFDQIQLFTTSKSETVFLRILGNLHEIEFKSICIGDLQPLVLPIYTDVFRIQFNFNKTSTHYFVVLNSNDVYHMISESGAPQQFSYYFKIDNLDSVIINQSNTRYYPPTCRLDNFFLDTRKRPWRLLAFRGNHILCLSASNTAKLVESDLLTVSLDTRLVYSQTLNTLFTCSLEETDVVFTTEKKLPDFEPGLILAEKLGNHSIVLVYPTSIAMVSQVNPKSVVSNCETEFILDAVMFKGNVYLRHQRSVAQVCLDGSDIKFQKLPSTQTISFLMTDNLNLYVGSGDKVFCYKSDFNDPRDSVCQTSSSSNMLMPTAKVELESCIVDVFGDLGYLHITFKEGYGDSIRWDRSEEDRKDIIRWNLPGPVSFGGLLPNGFLLYGRGLFVVNKDGVRSLRDHKNRIINYTVTSCCVVSNTIVFASRNVIRIIDANFTTENTFVSPLKNYDITLMDKFIPEYEQDRVAVLIPSKRVLFSSFRNFISVHDSYTFQPLHLNGLTVTNCKTAALWEFEENGVKFEHLVISDGFSDITSFTLTRNGNEIEASMRYRVKAIPMADQEVDECLSCYHNFVVLGRDHRVVVLDRTYQTPIMRSSVDERIKAVHINSSCIAVATHRAVDILTHDLNLITGIKFQSFVSSAAIGSTTINGEVVTMILTVQGSDLQAMYYKNGNLTTVKCIDLTVVAFFDSVSYVRDGTFIAEPHHGGAIEIQFNEICEFEVIA